MGLVSYIHLKGFSEIASLKNVALFFYVLVPLPFYTKLLKLLKCA